MIPKVYAALNEITRFGVSILFFYYIVNVYSEYAEMWRQNCSKT